MPSGVSSLNPGTGISSPCPLPNIVVLHGEPVFVPPDADEEECERLRRLVTDRMNDMADRCDVWWGGEPLGKPGFDLPLKK